MSDAAPVPAEQPARSLDFDLVVVSLIAGHEKGARITDGAEIAALLDAGGEGSVVKVAKLPPPPVPEAPASSAKRPRA